MSGFEEPGYLGGVMVSVYRPKTFLLTRPETFQANQVMVYFARIAQ